MHLRQIQSKEKALSEWAILVGYRGSVAHGMYLPPEQKTGVDDIDIMSVCVPPIEYYYGLEYFGNKGTKEIFEEEWDIVVYEIRKYLRLLEKGNPNVISLLWLEPQDYIKITPEGQLLIDSRDIFSTKEIYHSFAGYAYDQLYKMEHAACKGYMGEKRKKLVEQFGYDTKNAAHLVRLLRMAIEFLGTGKFIVKRPDASQLLDIKNGVWTLEEVKAEAELLFYQAEQAYKNSSLPETIDREKVNALAIAITSAMHV